MGLWCVTDKYPEAVLQQFKNTGSSESYVRECGGLSLLAVLPRCSGLGFPDDTIRANVPEGIAAWSLKSFMNRWLS